MAHTFFCYLHQMLLLIHFREVVITRVIQSEIFLLENVPLSSDQRLLYIEIHSQK